LIRVVLIDLGDTLVYLSRSWDDVFRDNLQSVYAYLKNSELKLDFQDFAKIFIHEYEKSSAVSHFYKIEIPIQDIMSKVLRKAKLRDNEGTLVRGAIKEFYEPEIKAWQLYPDAIQTLQALRTNGFRMGLISNAKSDYAVRAILEKNGLPQFFGVILTSAELRMRKPRPDLFSRALAVLETKPSEAVFVGDSVQSDMLGARIVGMRSIHVVRKPVDHPHFLVPDVTVNSLTEAFTQITKWNDASLGKVSSLV
jgi:HAD superfamily hydrolase (TIGR01662 family)